jgi:metal transporter CNNM
VIEREATNATTVSNAPTTSRLPVLKPLALKGLGFLRSRSAPPTPRDVKDPSIPLPPPDNASHANLNADRTSRSASRDRGGRDQDEDTYAETATVIITDTEDVTAKAPEVPTIIVDSYQLPAPPPPPALKANVTDTQLDLGTIKGPKQLPAQTMSLGQIPAGAPNPQIALVSAQGISRSGSPAPSLEAVLLDRKRRLAGAGTGGTFGSTPSLGVMQAVPIGREASSRAASVKGARFKSSPLGGGDATGVVIADLLKESVGEAPSRDEMLTEGEGASAGGDPYESWIPSGKDKEAPDK